MFNQGQSSARTRTHSRQQSSGNGRDSEPGEVKGKSRKSMFLSALLGVVKLIVSCELEKKLSVVLCI